MNKPRIPGHWVNVLASLPTLDDVPDDVMFLTLEEADLETAEAPDTVPGALKEYFDDEA